MQNIRPAIPSKTRVIKNLRLGTIIKQQTHLNFIVIGALFTNQRFKFDTMNEKRKDAEMAPKTAKDQARHGQPWKPLAHLTFFM